MGRLFATFAEAWEFFLAREEPLESFFADLPEGESYVLAWLLGFDAALVPRIQVVQRAFGQLPWITPQPAHFLHTSIAAVSVSRAKPNNAEIRAVVERAQEVWSGVPTFEVEYARVNCFHDAVVVEAAGAGPRILALRLVEAGYEINPTVFLPHVTIGAFNAPADPSPLREALVPLRDSVIGKQQIVDAQLCVVPASRTTILSPWEVVGRVRFRP